MIDLSLLPKKARQQLIDYYSFLVDRYAGNNRKPNKMILREDLIDKFFDQFSLNMESYNFDREEIYGR
jgi:hypothetical protein